MNVAEALEELIDKYDFDSKDGDLIECAWCLLQEAEQFSDDLEYYYGLEGLSDCRVEARKWLRRYEIGKWDIYES